MPAYKSKKEIGLRQQSQRPFLENKTGRLTIELFRYVMDNFISLWTTPLPGLDCFLICDNLSVHKDCDIIKDTLSKGIHLINIMPGSSHWFQVHDQEPFAILKKSVSDEKKKNSPPVSLQPKERQTISMAEFYEVEAKAFKHDVVASAFEKVRLWPWNPKLTEKKLPGELSSFCGARQQAIDKLCHCCNEGV